MKIYFLSSPRGVSDLKPSLDAIYTSIKKLGHTHVTDFLVDVDVENFYLSDIEGFYKDTLLNLKKADVCVFETTTPSLAVGHLISTALQLGKPVIALYSGSSIPFFLSGVNDDKVQVVQYDLNTLEDVLKSAIEYAQETADVRFNFFISPSIGNYLDWISKEKKIPRSVYLRNLIEKDMIENDEYNS